VHGGEGPASGVARVRLDCQAGVGALWLEEAGGLGRDLAVFGGGGQALL